MQHHDESTAQPTAGDQLDELFAEMAPLEAKLNRLVGEMNAIEKTPTGRWHKKLKPEQAHRLDTLVEEQGRVLEKLRPLTKKACQIVADATV